MPGSRVDRLHLRCRAPRARGAEALSLRTRLERAARTHLPAALDRALEQTPSAPGHGERRVFLDRLAVTIDFDPTVYDDVTLAALWAARVRAAVEVAARGPTAHVFADDAAFLREAVRELLARGALPWWFDELAPARTLTPFQLLAALEASRVPALADALVQEPALALRLLTALRPIDAALVASGLAGAFPWTRLTHVEPPIQPSPTAGAQAVPADARARSRAGNGVAGSAPAGTADQVSDDRGVARAWRAAPRAVPTAREWLALLRFAGAGEHATALPGGDTQLPDPIDERAAPRAPRGAQGAESTLVPADRRPAGRPGPPAHEADARPAHPGQHEVEAPGEAWWTGAAGLVLLYPWLARFLTDDRPDAESRGELSAVIVGRLLALGELAAPGEPAMLRDPLIRLLAGADPRHVVGDPPAPADSPALGPAADAVLTRFAGSLRGFESSSPDYVRRQFVQRGGLVQPLDDGQVRVRLEPAPLDLLLNRLSYPLTAFRLPWTPVVHIEVVLHA